MPSEKARRFRPRSSCSCASTLPAQKAEITVPLRFDQYYTLDQVYEAAPGPRTRPTPQLTTLETVGKSEEGRPIMAMTVNNPKTGRRPRQARRSTSTATCTATRSRAATSRSTCSITCSATTARTRRSPALVDKTCFYVVPVVNVDGRYHFFADANTPSSNRSLRIPIDDDRDGLVDEDAADDLDGDGNICTMRKKDPFGPYKTDPEDPRLMVRVKPGEKGEWTLLGDEGLDNDGDGQINEDGEGYVDPNRNWGFDWAPALRPGRLRRIPVLRAVGLKALAEWTMTKTNIVFAWSFHNNGGMFLRGPSRKGLGEYPPQDVAVYDYLGKQAERIIPGYRYMISWKDLYTTYGDSGEWLTQTLGAYFYCAEVFQGESEAFKGVSERQRARHAPRGGRARHLLGGRLRARAAQVQRQRRPGRALQALEGLQAPRLRRHRDRRLGQDELPARRRRS